MRCHGPAQGKTLLMMIKVTEWLPANSYFTVPFVVFRFVIFIFIFYDIGCSNNTNFAPLYVFTFISSSILIQIRIFLHLDMTSKALSLPV